MRQNNLVEVANEPDVMLPHHIPATHRVKPDLTHRPRSRPTAATIAPHRVQFNLAPLRNRFSKRERGAARRILLPPMMRLHDLDVVFLAEHPSCLFGQRQQQIHRHAEVGGHQNR